MFDFKKVYGGIPFVHEEFVSNKLITLVAITRRDIDDRKLELIKYLDPNIACNVYEKCLGQSFREEASIPMSDEHMDKIDECINLICEEVPQWTHMFSISIEYRYLTNGQTSLTNPLAPQIVYLGELCFSTINNLKEILVHEYSHIWCGFMCEVNDFQKANSTASLYLPSGTGPKDPRGILLASLFAAAALNYYYLSGHNTKKTIKLRVEHLYNYLSDTLVTLDKNTNMTRFGNEIVKDLYRYLYGKKNMLSSENLQCESI